MKLNKGFGRVEGKLDGVCDEQAKMDKRILKLERHTKGKLIGGISISAVVAVITSIVVAVLNYLQIV